MDRKRSRYSDNDKHGTPSTSHLCSQTWRRGGSTSGSRERDDGRRSGCREKHHRRRSRSKSPPSLKSRSPPPPRSGQQKNQTSLADKNGRRRRTDDDSERQRRQRSQSECGPSEFKSWRQTQFSRRPEQLRGTEPRSTYTHHPPPPGPLQSGGDGHRNHKQHRPDPAYNQGQSSCLVPFTPPPPPDLTVDVMVACPSQAKIIIPPAAMVPLQSSLFQPPPLPLVLGQLLHFQEGLVLDKLTEFLRSILMTFYALKFPQEWASSSSHQISLELIKAEAKREKRKWVTAETEGKFLQGGGGLANLDISALRVLIQALIGPDHPVIHLVTLLTAKRNDLCHSSSGGLSSVVAEMGRMTKTSLGGGDSWVTTFLAKFEEMFEVDPCLMKALPKQLDMVRKRPLMYIKYRNFLQLTVDFMHEGDFRTAGKVLGKTWKEVRSDGHFDITGLLILTYFCEHRVHSRLDEFLERIRHYNEYVAKTEFFRNCTSIGASAQQFLEDFEGSETGVMARIPRRWYKLGLKYLSLVTQFRAICKDEGHPAWKADDNHPGGGGALAAIQPFRCYQGLRGSSWECSGSCCGGGGGGNGGSSEQFTDLKETLIKSTMIHSVGVPMAWSSLNRRSVEPVISFLMRDLLLGEEEEPDQEVKLQAYFDYFCLVLRSYKGWLSEVANM